MKIEQTQWTEKDGWASRGGGPLERAADLVLIFGSREALLSAPVLPDLRKLYPAAEIMGCSTAGQIRDVEVCDQGIVATAIQFERTRLDVRRVRLVDGKDSFEAGRRLAGGFSTAGLTHLFVLSDGTKVNGSDLVKGLREELPPEVAVTGGLSADGARFERTLVCVGNEAADSTVAAVGFYGGSLRVGYASLGGWDPFGPERLVTRSEGNVLYELDGRSALALYKQYFGDHAAQLPASGLLFPLSLRGDGARPGVVRTILGVDEATQSLRFAGDIPKDAYVRLMKANFERLIEGASGAARACSTGMGGGQAELAILISCVGRKLVLQQRVEEEVESVREVLGSRPVMTGFYSYGEISPFTPSARCELHNQTMTITTFSEGESCTSSS